MTQTGKDRTLPYNALSEYLRARFGSRVQRISLNAGCTCPNRDGTLDVAGCIYCDNISFNPALLNNPQTIAEQVASAIKRVGNRYKTNKFIAYFQTFSNTYGSPERLHDLYNEALSFPEVVALSIATRPDCLEPPVLEALSDLACKKPVWIELGLQSAHDETLIRINRHHTVQQFVEAVHKLSEIKVEIITHVILGLPGESIDMMLQTAKFLAPLPLQGIKIHHLHAVKGTTLAQQYAMGLWQPLTLEAYIELLASFLEHIPAQFVIHRLMGDCPDDLLIAPKWHIPKATFIQRVIERFTLRGTFQGAIL